MMNQQLNPPCVFCEFMTKRQLWRVEDVRMMQYHILEEHKVKRFVVEEWR